VTTGFRTFHVSFLVDATEGNVAVTANDVEQALKAARLKLAMRFATDIEITGVRRQGPVQVAAFDQRVESSDPAAILLQVARVLHADPTLTLDGDTPESTAFFLSALCLVDNGHVLPDQLATDLERLLDETSISWRWGIDPYDESRPPLDPLACISDIAGELIYAWRPTPVVLTDRDVFELQYGYQAPVDFDEGVDFTGNSMAYAYILLAGAHKLLAEKPDEDLVERAERILPRFMAANPTASEATSDALLQASDGLATKM